MSAGPNFDHDNAAMRNSEIAEMLTEEGWRRSALAIFAGALVRLRWHNGREAKDTMFGVPDKIWELVRKERMSATQARLKL